MDDWFGWLLLIVVLVLLALAWWWWKRRQGVTAPPPSVETPAPVRASTVTTPEALAPAPATPAPSAADDLAVIEGIGPKISGLLIAAGIRTFAQLAVADVAVIKGILSDAGLRLNDPTTWPDQAKLAAAGKWDDLKALQDSLRAGRRV
jgi:predicted flap endonuclease-1-like 5' DNA nuclease